MGLLDITTTVDNKNGVISPFNKQVMVDEINQHAGFVVT
jgi:hypothetical protein